MNKKAFTLVELLFVATIIWILWTIWFVSFTSYLPDSRDASRLEWLSKIKKSMGVFRIKLKLPIPDNKVDIQLNWNLVSYQWYLSESILDLINYWASWKNRGKDPKDWVYYTYYLTKDLKRFQLMWFLENQSKTAYFLNWAYSDWIDYSKRYLTYYWDQLWIITQSWTNTPIQELNTYKSQWYINFTWSLIWDFNLWFKNNEVITSNDMLVLTNKIKESLKISSVAVVSNETWTWCAWTINDINWISTALSEVTYVNWTRSDTPWTCTWNCKIGYTWNWTSCINSRTYTCWAKPEVWTIWNTVSNYTQTWNWTSWTPADDSVTEYNITSSINSCRFICATWYTWNWSICVSNTQNVVCTWLPTNASWNTVSNITQNWNWTTWIPSNVWVFNISPSTTECRFTCNTNYTWNWTSCVPNSRVYVCNAKPANSSRNTVSWYIQTWNWTSWTPIDTTTTYNITGASNSCRYVCNSSSYWNWSSCLQYVNWACTSLPANAWYHNNTTSYTLVNALNWTTLSATSAWYNASPTVNTCQYKCNTSSYWWWSSCLQYVNWACTSLPANAWYHNNTTSYTLVNALNWTTLSATSAWYNASPTVNTCQFKCQTWYYWNWSSCVLQWSWNWTTTPYTFINPSGTLTYPTSCYNLLISSNPDYKVWTSSPWNWTVFANWNYTIDPDWAWAISPFTVYCDMQTDWWWYTYYPVASWISTASYSANNSCKSLGMDMVVPRSKNHWLSMFNLYWATYFNALPWIYSLVAWNYTTCIMRSPAHHASWCSNWTALWWWKWWVRDSTYSEPNWDYTAWCRLWLYSWNTWFNTTAINNWTILINDGSCMYSTTRYICSTNDKP